MIRHITHNQIDRKKWDACIDQSPNERIYARSWFLDAVSPNWEALVEDDYCSVMPLPVKQKWGIKYALSPTYAQQLGVFGNINNTLLEMYITSIPAQIKYVIIGFNDNNNFDNSNLNTTKRDNYVLNTNADYSLLHSAYSSNTKRNLKKALGSRLQIETHVSKEDYFQFIKQIPDNKYNKNSLSLIERIIDASFLNNAGNIWAARNNENEIIAAFFLIKYKNRSYYLNPVSSSKGKESRAMFLLVDTIIKSLAGKEHILDFEGSSVASIAQFFSGFGASKIHFWNVKINRLPWPLNLIKA